MGLKIDLAGVINLAKQLQQYEGKGQLTIDLDVTAELGAGAKGELTLSKDPVTGKTGWQIALSTGF